MDKLLKVANTWWQPDTWCWTNVVSMLVRMLPNIEAALVQRRVFAGNNVRTRQSPM